MLFTISSLAQHSILNNKPPKASYSKRSKDHKAGGWLLTGAGTIALIASLSADKGQRLGGSLTVLFTWGAYQPEYTSYAGAYVLSSACLVGGIYL